MDLEKDSRTRLALLDRVRCVWATTCEEPVDIVLTSKQKGFVTEPHVHFELIETTFVDNHFQMPGVILAIMIHSIHAPATRGEIQPPRVQLKVGQTVVFDDCVGRIIERHTFMPGELVQIFVTAPPSMREIEVSLLGYEKPIRANS